jgi:hypothetical protein
MTKFEVVANWDADAGVWVAHSDELPGLVAEHGDWQQLKLKLASLAAELVALNKVPLDAEGGQLHILIEDRISVAA